VDQISFFRKIYYRYTKVVHKEFVTRKSIKKFATQFVCILEEKLKSFYFKTSAETFKKDQFCLKALSG